MPQTEEDFVSLILQHEGLVSGQTPFRITNQAMAKWNTIHGFPIAKTKKPVGRENFFFLQDPRNVVPAVRRQLQNYVKNPKRYGLPKNPTVGQALGVFDQSGLKGKLAFLKQRCIDPNT